MIRSPRKALSRPRRRVHIDQSIQDRMIVLLVLLEVVLVSAAVIYLYYRFDSIIEESLYRIHHAPGESPAEQMLIELLQVVIFMAIANLVALLVADRWWAWHIASILERFNDAIEKSSRLDLTRQEVGYGRHQLLDLTTTWRLYERQIWLDVRRECAALEPPVQLDPESVARLRESIRRLRILVNDEN